MSLTILKTKVLPDCGLLVSFSNDYNRSLNLKDWFREVEMKPGVRGFAGCVAYPTHVTWSEVESLGASLTAINLWVMRLGKAYEPTYEQRLAAAKILYSWGVPKNIAYSTNDFLDLTVKASSLEQTEELLLWRSGKIRVSWRMANGPKGMEGRIWRNFPTLQAARKEVKDWKKFGWKVYRVLTKVVP